MLMLFIGCYNHINSIRFSTFFIISKTAAFEVKQLNQMLRGFVKPLITTDILILSTRIKTIGGYIELAF